jgi:hypothetical protein
MKTTKSKSTLFFITLAEIIRMCSSVGIRSNQRKCQSPKRFSSIPIPMYKRIQKISAGLLKQTVDLDYVVSTPGILHTADHQQYMRLITKGIIIAINALTYLSQSIPCLLP